MPGGDRRGPMGMGPMTGRAAGYCRGHAAPGRMNWGFRGGFAAGRRGGGGFGRRNRFYATGLTGRQRAAFGYAGFRDTVFPDMPEEATPVEGAVKEEHLEGLKTQVQHAAQVLEDLRKRIEGLEAGKGEQ